MKTSSFLSFILVFSCPFVPSFSQGEQKVEIFIYKTKFEGLEDQELKRNINRDFQDIIAEKILSCDQYLQRKSSLNDDASAFFLKESELRKKVYADYKQDSVLAPSKTDAVIFSLFQIRDKNNVYMNMGIYTEQQELNYRPLSEGRKYQLTDLGVPEIRKQILRKLVDTVLDDKTIIKLISITLELDRELIDCMNEISKGEIIIRFDKSINDETYTAFSSPRIFVFKNSSISSDPIKWQLKRKFLGIFTSKKSGDFSNNEENINLLLKKPGKYDITFIASGSRLSDTLNTKLKLKPRQPKAHQSVAFGMGAGALTTSLISYLRSQSIYDQYKVNSSPSRELEYERAKSLNDVAEVTFYSGVALVFVSILDYHLRIPNKSKWPKVSPSFKSSCYGTEFGFEIWF